MIHTVHVRIAQAIVQETIGDFLYFPVWWYSKGLLRAAQGIRRSLARREEALALRLWVTTLFTPMYGQRDWQSIIISFIFRVLILIVRFVLFFVWIVLHLAFFLLYLVLPLFLLYAIITRILS